MVDWIYVMGVAFGAGKFSVFTVMPAIWFGLAKCRGVVTRRIMAAQYLVGGGYRISLQRQYLGYCCIFGCKLSFLVSVEVFFDNSIVFE